ncbi:MAG: rhodanese-like domain-containing protein [Candidatus Binatia bacterium]
MKHLFRKIKILVSVFALFFGLVIYLGKSSADSTKYPQFAQYQLPEGVTFQFVYLDQLVDDIIQKKRPMIIDVRSRGEYEEAHIKGSFSIPLNEIRRRMAEIPKDRPVVLY